MNRVIGVSLALVMLLVAAQTASAAIMSSAEVQAHLVGEAGDPDPDIILII